MRYIHDSCADLDSNLHTTMRCSSMQPLILVYRPCRDDLVCKHHDEVLFWGNEFFSLVGRGVSPAPNQQSTPIFSSVPSNLQCCQAKILHRILFEMMIWRRGRWTPSGPRSLFCALFGQIHFFKASSVFLPCWLRYLFLTDLEFLLWNEVRNWFFACNNIPQLMLVTTATNGGSVPFWNGGII